MKAYTLGNWTNATVETLRFIQSANARNKPSRQKELPGSAKNWAYTLLEGNYLSQKDKHFIITSKGEQLLDELLRNPPPKRRPKYMKAVTSNIDTIIALSPEEDKPCIEATLIGEGLSYKKTLKFRESLEVMDFIKKILNKK